MSVAKQLKKLIDKITPQLKVAGVKDDQLSLFDPKGKSDDEIAQYIEKVTALTLKGGAYHGFMSIYGLHGPEFWVQMAAFGENNLREHKLLRAEAKKLRLAWRKLHVKGPQKDHPQPDQPEGDPPIVCV